MTKDEGCEMRRDMHKGVKMMIEELTAFGKSKNDFKMDEMMDISDILKDMSEVEKNLAKADYYDRKMN